MKKIVKTTTILTSAILLSGLSGLIITDSMMNTTANIKHDSPTVLAGLNTTIVGSLNRFEYYGTAFAEALEVGIDMEIRNMTNFRKFVTITNEAVGAKYYLVGAFQEDGADGVIKYAVWTSLYYDLAGALKTGGSDDRNSKFSIENLIYFTPSSLERNWSYQGNIKPNEFINYMTTNGITVDLVNFAKYYTLTSIPSDAVFTITNARIGDYVNNVINYITFDLIISKWNGSDGTQSIYYENDMILGLTDQYRPTEYVLNETKLPIDVTPSTFITKLKADGAVVEAGTPSVLKLSVDNTLWLKNYGQFISLVAGSTVFLDIKEQNDTIGVLSFDISADIINNLSGDRLGSVGGGYNPSMSFSSITLNLAKSTCIPPKTEVITKTDSPIVNDEKSFIESLKNADGSWNLAELANYVVGLNTIPTTAIIQDITFNKETTNKAFEFSLKVSGWWNGVTSIMEPEKTYIFETKTEDYFVPVETPTDQVQTTSQCWWWWILIVAAVIITLGGFGWWYYKYKKNNSKVLKTPKTKKSE